MKFKKNLLLWNYWANHNQTLMKWFLGGPLPKLCPAFQNSDQDARHILFLLSKWFQTRRFLWEFPIGSYVKLSSAVAAILVGGLKCQTYFWKGTTQGSFQQSLVEIGSVVSHKNLLLRNHWANCNQTLVEWSLDGPLPKLCPVISTSNQDGRQAKN
jgi:hypothetical protein